MLLRLQDSFPDLTRSNPGLWAKIPSLSSLGTVTGSSSALLSSAGSPKTAPSPCSWICYKLRKNKERPKKRSRMLGEEEEAEDPCKRQWLSNYRLNEVYISSLFDEFLEMGM